jgi:hypothetical protein
LARTSRSAAATVTELPLQMMALQGILLEEERAPVARSGTARAMEVFLAADAADDGNATLRFAPMPPNCTGGLHRAGASSSRQPGGDGFPGDLCIGMERHEVPWQTVERARSEYNDWLEFLEVGASV